MPIVDPGPFWKVDFALDHAMTEFSHSLGRSLPTADVGLPAAQLGGQLYGGEIARPTGAGRPGADMRCFDLAALKLPI